MKPRMILLILCSAFFASIAAGRANSAGSADTIAAVGRLQSALSLARDSIAALKVRSDVDRREFVTANALRTEYRVYRQAASTAFALFLGWLGLIIFYYIWSIHRYVHNYGLSDREWKILYPGLYDNWFDRLQIPLWYGKSNYLVKRTDYAQMREQILQSKSQLQGGAAALKEPETNPYEKDSFGLPPGTIRGTIALTALVMFLLVEGVNLFAPVNLERQYAELLTSLQMVLAFYFGSRAVEVFQARERTRQVEAEKTGGAVSPGRSSAHESGKPALDAALPSATAAEEPPAEFTANRGDIIRQTDELPDLRALPETFSKKNFPRTAPLSLRVMCLTSRFETSRPFPECCGAVTGNFDKQGISFGAMQWNIGKNSLQPLLRTMWDSHGPEVRKAIGAPCFESVTAMLARPHAEQMQWALSLQNSVPGKQASTLWRINTEWRKAFRALGLLDEMILLQLRFARTIYERAVHLALEYEVPTERGVALMFDICTQNGGINPNTIGTTIRQKLLTIPVVDQVARMISVAELRASVSLPQWRADVLRRKMTIVNGEGKVHGEEVNLAKEYNITLASIADANGKITGA